MTWLFSPRSSHRLLIKTTAVFAAVCTSTFASAQIPVKPAKGKSTEAAETQVSSEQMTGRPDREIVLERDVEIIRGETTLTADHATYWIEEDEVEASGNVKLNRFGDRYTGDKMRFKIDEGRGYVLNPTYHMKANNAQGKADRIDFEAEDRAVITQGTYSTCEGPDPDWYLKSNTMNLDNGRDIGTAGATLIYFKGVPILGTPYMSFPLSDARKSGVLLPTMGTTSTGGFEVAVPYYFNIAPNRDLTLTPKYIERRGLQLGVDARYLDSNYVGQTKFEYLANDAETQTSRYSYASIHNQRFTPQASFGWNLNGASDDNYPSDFSRNLATSTQRLLLRDLFFNYAGSFWNATARASNYQVLQDPLAPIPIAQPYDRLPQFTLQGGQQDINGFDWSAVGQATRFWHPDKVRGERYVFNPSVSYPIIRPGYFLTPKVSLNAATYNVQNPVTGINSKYDRVLPTFSLDGGLIFERETNIFGDAATQTLEPRLFYVRTPYKNQSNPVFDTAEADLSFPQLFSENRFIGNDRISDANQLTLAMVSRYIEPTGAERLRVALAQRLYFEDQQVTLPGVAPSNASSSDWLASGVLRVSDSLSTEANLQYSATEKNVSRANAGVSWRPESKKVLNLTYRLDEPNNLRQVDVSGQWPIGARWYGAARLNYSLIDSKVAEGLLGFEYKADCWIFRIVGQRIPTATGKSTSSLFFQLELSGLSKIGSDPMEALRTSIPGYQVINSPSSVTY